MSIDTSGKWWRGSEAGDLDAYLRALSVEGYPISEFRLSKCSCGEIQFTLQVEQDEGIALRTCVACKATKHICDSEENADAGQRLKKYKCVTCKANVANLGVGFSLNENGTAVRWVYVGQRCVNCGVLGAMVEWKIGYEPSLHLLDQA